MLGRKFLNENCTRRGPQLKNSYEIVVEEFTGRNKPRGVPAYIILRQPPKIPARQVYHTSVEESTGGKGARPRPNGTRYEKNMPTVCRKL